MKIGKSKNRGIAMAALAVMAATGLGTMGCERPNWEDPEYIAKVLEEGDERTRQQAVDLLRDVEEEDQEVIAPAATTAYMEEDRLRSDIMHHLLEWRTDAAMEAYLEELAEDHTGRSARVARTLGRIEARDAIPQMVEIFEETGNNDRKVGILKGLAAMPDEAALEVAVSVLELDVDNNPIDLHRASCKLIGELALTNPDAITDDAREKVIYARFLGDEDGRHTSAECGLAIQQIGPSMVPHLMTLFEGENEAVQRILMTYDNPAEGEHFPQNQSRQRAVEHLSSLRAEEAVEPFIEHLNSTVEAPEDIESDEQVNAWAGTERRVLNEMIRGLGYIGASQAREVLEGILSREIIGENWSDIASIPEAFQYQQNAARALTDLNDREAREALLSVEVQSEWVAHLQGQEVAAVEIFRPAWLGAQGFTWLATADDREPFEEFAEQIGDEELKERVQSFASAFDVLDECDSDDEAELADCYAGFIEGDDAHQSIKAIFETVRLSEDVAAPVIAEAIKTEDLTVRQYVTTMAYRAPSAELQSNVETLIADSEDDDDDDIRADRRRLQMLHGWLAHHVE